ncbi:MAG: T9SS type A sorting domain-containing protein [Bacteroidetes bacterium]|nr:T9SS type A sorting domain-containing protein [Bacteroidota bacterium]
MFNIRFSCFFIGVLLLGTIAKGQDYRVLIPSYETCYSDSVGSLYCIHIDSFKAFGFDTSYYNYRHVDMDSLANTIGVIGGTCVDAKYVSWLGSEVIKKIDGEYIFINEENDSIKIQSKGTVNAKWRAFELGGGNFIESEITNIDTAKVLGIIDSIKTLTFNARDSLNNLIPNAINGQTIRLSKSYGLTSALNFKKFPDQIISYELAGIYETKQGAYAIKNTDIFDFDPGDEFHYKIRRYYLSAPLHVNYTLYLKKTILNKIATPDSIIYIDSIQSLKKHLASDHTDSFVYANYRDTTVINLVKTNKVDLLPFEAFHSFSGAYVVIEDSSIYNGRVQKKFIPVNGYYYTSINCLNIDDIPTLGIWENFVEGLGDVYLNVHFVPAGFSYDLILDSLVYFKKGIETWGDSIVFSNIDTTSFILEYPSSTYSLFPNPVVEFSILRFNNPANAATKCKVYDILGRLVKEYSDINSSELTIYRQDYETGIYLIRVLAKNDRLLSYGKFIIQ